MSMLNPAKDHDLSEKFELGIFGLFFIRTIQFIYKVMTLIIINVSIASINVITKLSMSSLNNQCHHFKMNFCGKKYKKDKTDQKIILKYSA
jgi:hypothetical protein